MGAINNPNLPANERKDLIEDLNEEGFRTRTNPDRKMHRYPQPFGTDRGTCAVRHG